MAVDGAGLAMAFAEILFDLMIVLLSNFDLLSAWCDAGKQVNAGLLHAKQNMSC